MKKKIYLLIPVFLYVICLASAVTDEGLINYWDMDFAGVLDIHNSNNALVSDCTISTGVAKIGNSTDCAAGQSALMDNSTVMILPGGNWSWCLWHYQDGQIAPDTTWQHTILLGTGTTGGADYNDTTLKYDRDTASYGITDPIGIRYGNTADADIIPYVEAEFDARWKFVCATYDSSTTTLSGYVNGTLNGTRNIDIVLNIQRFAFGQRGDGDDTYNNFKVDEVSLWNRTLSPTDISDLYNNFNGLPYSGITSASSTPTGSVITQLVSPSNNTINNTQTIDFTYNVTSTNSSLDNCSLYINGLLNATNTTPTNNSNNYFRSINLNSDGSYNWSVSCYDLDGNSGNTFNWTILIDSIDPAITTNMFNNSYFTNWIEAMFNFSDENLLYSYNISIDGTFIANRTSIDASTDQYNLSYYIGGMSFGQHNLTVRVTDSHTAQYISPINNEKENSGIKYSITQDKFIKVYPKYYSDYNTATTTKQLDRYTFEFEKKVEVDSKSTTGETFVVESAERIDIIKNSDLCGHIVIPDIGKNGYWVDFNTEGIKSCDVKKINDYKVEVTIKGLSGKKLSFNSVGELNVNEQTYVWNNMGMLNITAFSALNGINVTDFSIYRNGSLLGSTTNSTFQIINLTNQTSMAITIVPNGYASADTNITINSQYTLLTFYLYTSNSFNITFRDDADNLLIDDALITVDFYSDNSNYSYTTDTGLLYVDGLSQADYTIRYRANQTYGGRWRFYYFTLSNQSHNYLDLYLTSDANNITATVYDSITLNTLSGAVVYLQKRFSDNTYKTVAQYSTDVAGRAYFEVSRNEFYKFMVDYPWKTTKLVTSEQFLEDTNYNLYIDISDDYGGDFFDKNNIQYNLFYIDNTKEFSATYNDPDLVATNYCLYLKKYVQYGQQTINSTCSTSSSGTLTIGGMNENITYYGVLTAKIDGQETVLSSAWKEFVSSNLNSAKFGLWIAVVLIMVFSFLSMLHIIAMFLGVAGLVFSKLLGLISIPFPTIFTIVGISIFLGMMIQVFKK